MYWPNVHSALRMYLVHLGGQGLHFCILTLRQRRRTLNMTCRNGHDSTLTRWPYGIRPVQPNQPNPSTEEPPKP